MIAKTPANRIAVDPKLRVFRAGKVKVEDGNHLVRTHMQDDDDVFPGLYALGDCAHVLDGNYAPIAQVAERQGLVRAWCWCEVPCTTPANSACWIVLAVACRAAERTPGRWQVCGRRRPN